MVPVRATGGAFVSRKHPIYAARQRASAQDHCSLRPRAASCPQPVDVHPTRQPLAAEVHLVSPDPLTLVHERPYLPPQHVEDLQAYPPALRQYVPDRRHAPERVWHGPLQHKLWGTSEIDGDDLRERCRAVAVDLAEAVW